MKVFALLTLFISILCQGAFASPSRRQTLQGYFVLRRGKVYFTELFHSTAPVYQVEWVNEKTAHEPLCAVNLIPTCRAVLLNFEKKVVTRGKKHEVILAHAILDAELKGIQARLKSSR